MIKKLAMVLALCACMTTCMTACTKETTVQQETLRDRGATTETTIVVDELETDVATEAIEEVTDVPEEVQETVIEEVQKLTDEELIALVKDKHNGLESGTVTKYTDPMDLNYTVHRADSENNTFIFVTEWLSMDGIGYDYIYYVYDANGNNIATKSTGGKNADFDVISIKETETGVHLFFEACLEDRLYTIWQYDIIGDDIKETELTESPFADFAIKAEIDGNVENIYTLEVLENGINKIYSDFQADVKEIYTTVNVKISVIENGQDVIERIDDPASDIEDAVVIPE